MDVPLFLFIPGSVTIQIQSLLLFGISGKQLLRTFLHHVVKPESTAIGKISDKGVFFCQYGEKRFRIFHGCDRLCHLYGKFICQPHNRQKLLQFFSQGPDHC